MNVMLIRIPKIIKMNLRGKPEKIASYGLHSELLPTHVAIIMDGNGRWAKKRLMPRAFGHRAGVERLRGIIQIASDIGLEALTLYAFSTENWKRPSEEIDSLCNLFVEFFSREIDALHQNGVVIRALGDIRVFPERVHALIENAEARTENNDGLKLNIAMNYGSHAELLRAVNIAAGTGKTDWTEEDFDALLYTHDLPPVDLLIRTGGDQRLSNFLLYQAAYAELMFVKEYWPDFSDELFLEQMASFASRSRRFGGLESES